MGGCLGGRGSGNENAKINKISRRQLGAKLLVGLNSIQCSADSIV